MQTKSNTKDRPVNRLAELINNINRSLDDMANAAAYKEIEQREHDNNLARLETIDTCSIDAFETAQKFREFSGNQREEIIAIYHAVFAETWGRLMVPRVPTAKEIYSIDGAEMPAIEAIDFYRFGHGPIPTVEIEQKLWQWARAEGKRRVSKYLYQRNQRTGIETVSIDADNDTASDILDSLAQNWIDDRASVPVGEAEEKQTRAIARHVREVAELAFARAIDSASYRKRSAETVEFLTVAREAIFAGQLPEDWQSGGENGYSEAIRKKSARAFSNVGFLADWEHCRQSLWIADRSAIAREIASGKAKVQAQKFLPVSNAPRTAHRAPRTAQAFKVEIGKAIKLAPRTVHTSEFYFWACKWAKRNMTDSAAKSAFLTQAHNVYAAK